MKKKYLSILALSMELTTSCNFLDVMPDKLGTIEYAFRDQVSAEKYLATCYSYIPSQFATNDVYMYGNEITAYNNVQTNGMKLLLNGNSVTSVSMGSWNNFYQAIRHCNIFLENVDQVRDLEEYDKVRWVLEVKFLKAYYHWMLVQKYGPIVVVRDNLPITSQPEEVRLPREPLDDCIEYIISLLDECIGSDLDEEEDSGIHLPDKIEMAMTEYGRITRPIAAALKAKILVHMASPFFNGNNNNYAGFKDKDGKALWPTTYDPAKWTRAAQACKEAIKYCDKGNHELYHYTNLGTLKISEDTRKILTFSQLITDHANNQGEYIWSNRINLSTKDYQFNMMPALNAYCRTARLNSHWNPTLEFVENFYSSNGVPIEEDKTWNENGWYKSRYEVTRGDAVQEKYIEKNYPTARLNTYREPRFYGDVAFDGSVWFGAGRTDESKSQTVKVLAGDPTNYPAGRNGNQYYSTTGYFIRKLTPYTTYVTEDTKTEFKGTNYAFPIIRLADLYLLYAEALNESLSAPNEEVYKYINLVRERAFLPPVEEAWANHSINPDKYLTKDGMRDIIQQERILELAFEGHYFYDLRRWANGTKKSKFDIFEQFNKKIRGWNVEGETVEDFNKIKIYYSPKFTQRDMLWPIAESEMMINTNLVQNPGW